MPTNILSSISSKPSLTIVNAEIPDFDIASGLSVSKVSIKFQSKIFRHMREDGVTIVDARALMPVVVDAEVIAPSLDQLININSALLDRNATWRISTKGIVIPVVMMDSDEIRQEPAMLSGLPQKLSFKSVLFNGANATVVEQPGDSSLTKRGLTLLQSATIDVQQLVTRIRF